MPQKHPPAKTAASCAFAEATGASSVGSGMAAEGAAAGRAPSERNAVQPTMRRMMVMATARPMMGLCMAEFLTAIRLREGRKVTRALAGGGSGDPLIQ